jgi:hypothetical protein
MRFQGLQVGNMAFYQCLFVGSKPSGAVVQIAGASEKRCIHHCIIVLKGLTSKQPAQWYL